MVKVLRICILMLGFKGLDTTTYTCFLVGPSLMHELEMQVSLKNDSYW